MLAIKTMWKKEIIDLVDIILRIIRHAKINKRNEKNTADNVNALAGVPNKNERLGRRA